jgi:hypothetical protein
MKNHKKKKSQLRMRLQEAFSHCTTSPSPIHMYLGVLHRREGVRGGLGK